MIGSSVDRLLALLELDAEGEDTFRAAPLKLSILPDRMYGGEVAARALAAAQRTVGAQRMVHVVQAMYLRPGEPTQATRLRVTRLRDGRRFSNRRVEVEQHGKVIFSANISFHRGGEGFAHQDQMPQVPPADGLAGIPEWTGGPSFWPDWIMDSGVELRPVPLELLPAASGSIPPAPHSTQASERAIWYRVPGDLPADPRVHACLWLYESDLSLVSSTRLPHQSGGRKGWQLISLNHTVWFHRPFRVDQWHLLSQRSSQATAGRGLGHGQVFTESGLLVAEVAQEGLAVPIGS